MRMGMGIAGGTQLYAQGYTPSQLYWAGTQAACNTYEAIFRRAYDDTLAEAVKKLAESYARKYPDN